MIKPTKFVDKHGLITWHLVATGTGLRGENGELHRDNDEPAMICPDGTKKWYQYGERHRVGAPAVIYPNGEKHWMQNGKFHREDGPAIEGGGQRRSSVKKWYLNGECHRVGAPAIIFEDGVKHWYQWYQDGKRHRIDGPAIEDSDGIEEWWLFGERYYHDGMPKSFKAASETLVALFPDVE